VLLRERAEGLAEPVRKGGVEVDVRDAADVVLPKDRRIQLSTST
jgi:hypothetical protein